MHTITYCSMKGIVSDKAPVSLNQEYPTEPLDKIPALQAKFELAGKKKTLAN